jgi:thioredoxin reductase (NADPH)
MTDLDVDVLVVGGGPAGLSAALRTARYDRTALVLDAGDGRSSWAQVNRDYLGFPGGVAATELRARGLEQLRDYDQVRVVEGPVDGAGRDGDAFTVSGGGRTARGRTIVLATGVRDEFPRFGGWEHTVGRSMFWCLACDGYESRGQRVLVLGHTRETAVEALQLTRFTRHTTLLTTAALDDGLRAALAEHGVEVVEGDLDDVVAEDGLLTGVITTSGRCLPVDRLFTKIGMRPRSELARQLGAAVDQDGYVCVDAEQRTSVPGVFAAGDVTRPHAHQIAAAVHQGSQAASAANVHLYAPALRGG